MYSPQQSEFLHSSYGRRAAQLCHCETPPVQWKEHCCHPADGGEERQKGIKDRSDCDPENSRELEVRHSENDKITRSGSRRCSVLSPMMSLLPISQVLRGIGQ